MTSNDTETSEILADTVNDERPIWQQASPHPPSQIMPGWLAHWIMGIRSRLNPPTPWVVFLGLDGSGKSSVLAALEKIFSPPSFAGVQTFYRHPGILYARLFQDLPNQPPADKGPAPIEHYRKRPHGMIKSIVKMGILALDWFVTYWSQLVHRRAKGYVILFDRHFFLDVSADPLRYRYGGPRWLAWLLARLLPQPDLVILLDAPVEILQTRKKEMPPEKAALQRAAYLELIQEWPNGQIIDVSQPLEDVINEAKQIIFRYNKN